MLPSTARTISFAVLALALLALLAPAVQAAPVSSSSATPVVGTDAVKAFRAKAAARRCATRAGRRARSRCVRTYLRRQAPAAVRILAPVAGERVSGVLTDGACAAAVARPADVRHVDFLVDGRHLNREERAPYRCSHFARGHRVDTSRLSDGPHVLAVRAVAEDGEVATAKTSFTVDNTSARAEAAARRKPKPGTTTTTPNPSPAPTTPTTSPAPSPDTSAPAVFSDDFESGSFSSWQHVQRAFDDRIRAAAAPAGHSGQAARFEVRNGDNWNDTARAELAWDAQLAAEGQTRTYSWSSWLAPDYPIVPLWQNILQWKNEGTGTPPLQITTNGDKLRLLAGPQQGYKILWETPLVRGQWLDFSIRIRWSERIETGWVEVSYGGRQVLARTPLQGLYPGLGNYLKVGLYRHPDITGTGVVYHDGVRVTT